MIANGKLFDDVLEASALLSSNFNKDGKTSHPRDVKGTDLVITNLGNLAIKQEFGKLQLQELYVIGTAAKTLAISIGVATLHEKMYLICRYQESLLPSANAYNIKNTAMQQLLISLA
ncbi:hypothetical protein [Nostoc sp.]|uniref:hypothetical protein n=1 Tax=Nostoc sp. TaxID=1180 RepID=UPI002FFACED0